MIGNNSVLLGEQQGAFEGEHAADGSPDTLPTLGTVGFAELTDSDGSQSFNLGTVLPANAIVIGHAITVATGFTDGVAGVFTFDMGLSGTLDAIANGTVLTVAGEFHGPLGARSGGRWQAVQVLATVLADVNVDTATAGAATFEVYFVILA